MTSALWAVEKMPERFRGKAARLEDLLQDRRLSNWALAVLTRMSPPTEGTVAWLRRHLASPAERERAGWLASRIAALCPAPPSALPEPFPRRPTYPLMGMTWQMLVEATAELGDSARPLAAWLSRLMTDEEVDLGLRIACARALQSLGGKGAHEALKSLLIARGRALEQLPIRLDRRQYTQATNQRRREALAYAADALRLCLGEQAPSPRSSRPS